MTDAALTNAEARRDALASQINAAQQQIDEWKRELRSVEQFITTWYSFAGVEAPEAQQSVAVAPSSEGAVMPPVPNAVSAKRGRNSKKEEVAEAAYEVIRERNEPVSRSDLYKELIARGLRIEGSDPEMVLSTMLWRMKDRVVRLKSGGYWLADVKNDEIGYEPAPPETEAELQVRIATEHPDMDASVEPISD
ncbi:MAG: hypothetical protein GX458_21515 [Phyllobacteriaceae bacterium]|nr:hypothetical protein [Phyllobacteriaceae bacterium]